MTRFWIVTHPTASLFEVKKLAINNMFSFLCSQRQAFEPYLNGGNNHSSDLLYFLNMIPPQIYRRGIQDAQGIIPAEIVDKYRPRVEELFETGYIDQEIINILIQERLDEQTSIRVVNAFEYGAKEKLQSAKKSERNNRAFKIFSLLFVVWIFHSLVTGKYSQIEAANSIVRLIEIVAQIAGVLYWIVKKLKIY